MNRNLWYAVNGSGQGVVFTSRPERNDHFKIWCGEQQGCFSSLVMQMVSDGFELPVMTWKDEPVTIELVLNVINASSGQESHG